MMTNDEIIASTEENIAILEGNLSDIAEGKLDGMSQLEIDWIIANLTRQLASSYEVLKLSRLSN